MDSTRDDSWSVISDEKSVARVVNEGTVLGLPPTTTVALFDMDGVLTSTTALHQKAWKQTFDSYLGVRDGDGFVPFTERDYLRYVDGRPRGDGIRAFLGSRHIEATDLLVETIGTRKNQQILASLERGEIDPYPGSVRYLAAARDAGLRVGVVTSSENGSAMLEAADLSRFVQARIDGTDIGRLGLRGKPAPDAFLACATAFGVDPGNAAVFEDALSGVQAASAGGFGYVVGVDRVGGGRHAAALRAAGADVVVVDLAELLPA